MNARRIAHLLIVVVLITSGTYLMVYLYRWEWNRALVSGVFFLTAEIALAASMILRRLRDLEARIDRRFDQQDRQQVAVTNNPAVLERLRETAPQPGSPFSWLEDTTTGGMGVFVPVLLGAGVVLSGLAYVVERIAGATAGAAMEKGLARRMGALALPATGLLPAPAGLPLATVGAELRAWEKEPLRGRQILARVALVALAGIGTAVAVDSLADATQNRPDADLTGMVSTVDLQISHKANRATIDTAEVLWFGCRGTLPRSIDATSITATGNTARFVLEPAVGHYAQRRFQGCLQDATFDLVKAKVTGFTNSAKP